MIRVVGNAPLWVDVGRTETRAPIAVVISSARGSWRGSARASAAYRQDLQEAEWTIEGMADAHRPLSSNVSIAGDLIAVVGELITPLQSEHLRALLERAETIVDTGVGDMNPEGT